MHNVKVTWKSLAALAGLIVSAISAGMTSHLFPPAYTVVLASVSGVILAVERYADSVDFRTAVFNPDAAAAVTAKPLPPTAVPAAPVPTAAP